MSTYDTAELRRMEAAATKAPWVTSDIRRGFIYLPQGQEPGGNLRCEPEGCQCNTTHNAALIAAVRNALPALLDDLEAMREVLREVEWSLYDGNDHLCPVCTCSINNGHAPGCKMARALGE